MPPVGTSKLWVLILDDGTRFVTHGQTAEDARAMWPAPGARVEPLEGAELEAHLAQHRLPAGLATSPDRKARNVTIKLWPNEHDVIAAAVARENAERVRRGDRRIAIAAWIRARALEAAQASCTPT